MQIKYNISIFFFLIIGFVVAGIIGFDVSWGKYNMEDLNDQFSRKSGFSLTTIFVILATIVSILSLLKVLKRWMGAFNFWQQKESYIFSEPLEKKGISRVLTYNILEGIIYFVVAGSLYFLTPHAHALAWVCIGMVLELIVFHAINRGQMRISLGSNGIALLTRDLTVIPLDKLKRVEKDFNEFFFIYPKTVKKIPLVYLSQEQKMKLVAQLKVLTANNNVFFSDTLNT